MYCDLPFNVAVFCQCFSNIFLTVCRASKDHRDHPEKTQLKMEIKYDCSYCDSKCNDSIACRETLDLKDHQVLLAYQEKL